MYWGKGARAGWCHQGVEGTEVSAFAGWVTSSGRGVKDCHRDGQRRACALTRRGAGCMVTVPPDIQHRPIGHPRVADPLT